MENSFDLMHLQEKKMIFMNFINSNLTEDKKFIDNELDIFKLRLELLSNFEK